MAFGSGNELAVVLKLVADQFQSELKKSEGALGDFARAITPFRAGLVAVGTALVASVKSYADFGDEALRTSQKLGISVEALTALTFAANVGDVEVASLMQGLGLLNKKLSEAANGNKAATDTFTALGIKVKDSNGHIRATDDVLLDLASAFHAADNDANKTAIAMALFGRSGKELIPFLNQGREGIQALKDEAARLGVVLSTEDARAADDFNDNMRRLEATVLGVRNTLGGEFLPTLNSFTENVLKGAQAFREWGSAAKQAMTDANSGIGWRMLSKLTDNLTGLPSVGFGSGGGGGMWSPEGINPAVLPNESGRKSGSLPAVMDADALAKLKEDYKNYITGVTSMGQDAIDKLKANYQLYITGLTLLGQEAIDKQRSDYQLYITGLTSMGNEALEKQRTGYQLYITGLTSMGQEAIDKLKSDYQLYITGLTAMGNEALEKQRTGYQLYITGLTAMGQEALDKQRNDYQLYITGLTSAGNEFIAKAQRERSALVSLRQAQLDAATANLASAEELSAKRDKLIRAQMASELELTEDQVDDILLYREVGLEEEANLIISKSTKTETERVAIMTAGEAKIAQESRRANGSVFEGWREGLNKYVTDTESMFGLGVDTARQAAQQMQSMFQTFFFDAMSGKINTLKQVMSSLLDFVKTILSQVAAQLATIAAMKALAGIANAGGASVPPGQPTTAMTGGVIGFRRFALGGPVYSNGDRVPALLQTGEGVINRRGMGILDKLNNGDLGGGGPQSIEVNVVNSGNQTKPRVITRRDQRRMVLDIIFQDAAANGRGRSMVGG